MYIFRKKIYFCTNIKNGHAQESRDAFCPGNNIAALTPKNMFFSSTQLNEQLRNTVLLGTLLKCNKKEI